ncbi:hypothetical protein [Glycomyces harbinensis]|uniref:Nickel/cobalt efflux system n=1 Tax=Glycomyces harbinensis TaxID=58114 RepID=A0A1G7DYL9_9ACTN|nr:hypothetical protein [Glycomyces harbinensis]SDE56583.1 nickel/cobalt exporter [Glycomyces harbinensis]
MNGFDARLLEAFDTALWPVAVAVALLVGAAHALRPGHGKTLVAAYLVAERGRWMHAAALAVIVAGLHTVSVLVIGLLWWAFAGDRAGSIEPVAVWGRLAVALLVLGLGAVLLRRQWRAFRHRRAHARARVGDGRAVGSDPIPSPLVGARADAAGAGMSIGQGRVHAEADGREHAHAGGDGHDDLAGVGHEGHPGGGRTAADRHAGIGAHHHDHHHGPPEGVAPWSWAGLFGIAAAGALIPSPAAFILLVSGLLTGRAALAVVMVACFGIGLAVTVLAVGLMVIAGRDWLGRRAKAHGPLARLGAMAPLAGAAAIVCGGFVLSAGALAALVVP